MIPDHNNLLPTHGCLLPPAVAGWLAGHKPLPLAALTLKWPLPPPRRTPGKCSPPAQPHNVPRATHVDVFLSGNPMSGRACIYSIFDCQSLSLSVNLPPAAVIVSSSPSSLFRQWIFSPDLVPLFLSCSCCLRDTTVCSSSTLEPQPSFSSVRLVGPGTACRCHSLSPSFQRPTTNERDQDPRTTSDRLPWYYSPCRTESPLNSTWSCRNSLRSLS